MCRPFATRSEDHDHHMTVFPSLKPAGRHEVIALKVLQIQAWQSHKYTTVQPEILNLAVEPKITIARILADLNLVVR